MAHPNPLNVSSKMSDKPSPQLQTTIQPPPDPKSSPGSGPQLSLSQLQLRIEAIEAAFPSMEQQMEQWIAERIASSKASMNFMNERLTQLERRVDERVKRLERELEKASQLREDMMASFAEIEEGLGGVESSQEILKGRVDGVANEIMPLRLLLPTMIRFIRAHAAEIEADSEASE